MSEALLGARAVCLDQAKNGLLKYCTASTNTIAISHVWSHSQGGRPEKVKDSTGFNACLHERYFKIARQFACQSYWMDTPCIPQDHQLRKEAIAEINNVFRSSRFTLICDMDVMRIDIARNRTLRTDESIIAALLVSDWNVRAWTLLEGLKGAENVYLLCKNDEVVPLADIVKSVHAKGNIDLAALFLTMDHLFPTKGRQKRDSKELGAERSNELHLETAASVLTHRHSSRQGDQIVIWSLLCGSQLSYTAENFWRDPLNILVNTGFLMSDAPRISGVKGLSWAPARPDLPLEIESTRKIKTRHFADEGIGSEEGHRSKDGLRARWLIGELKDEGFRKALRKAPSCFLKGISKFSSSPASKAYVDDILHQTSYFWHMGVLALSTGKRLRQVAIETGVKLENMGLLRTLEGPPFYDTVPYTFRGDGSETLVAVVERNPGGNWIWRKLRTKQKTETAERDSPCAKPVLELSRAGERRSRVAVRNSDLQLITSSLHNSAQLDHDNSSELRIFLQLIVSHAQTTHYGRASIAALVEPPPHPDRSSGRATPWQAQGHTPGDLAGRVRYCELLWRVDEGDDRDFASWYETKGRFDYDADLGLFIIRMGLTSLHDRLNQRLGARIEEHLRRLTAKHPDQLTQLMAGVIHVGSTSIDLDTDNSDDSNASPDPQSYRCPDGQFQHEEALYSSVVEVAYSQKRRRLPKVADDFIRRTKGNVSAVIALGIDYTPPKRQSPRSQVNKLKPPPSKIATVSIWREGPLQFADDGQEFTEVEQDEHVLRDVAGTLQPGTLTLPLTDFVPPCVLEDYPVHIQELVTNLSLAIPFFELYDDLVHAESVHQRRVEKKGKTNTRSRTIRKRKYTEIEQLEQDREAEFTRQEDADERKGDQDVDFEDGLERPRKGRRAR
ncbi:uncharacterized protein K452DRAFT_313875 [Aplosporella prunicola CBS 121167]|uniref:Heterokaryon incompatibility domain-containing protein n=1 Tax=Aplosporella prunicola CBS 121167 TaxID=1176127 RepID=A0A6A6AXT8_9PEZI|nr:uncharacterized protein K452DRAFT_313875 [Aplosporella prunicola CBS 121167]KAF2135587.1 hypothetical protein K452DRAFT_313875 [Aplosporella prunicola CBS 121167]